MLLCACNHYEVSHFVGGCRGLYEMPSGRTTRCDCTTFRPLTAEQATAMRQIETIVRSNRT